MDRVRNTGGKLFTSKPYYIFYFFMVGLDLCDLGHRNALISSNSSTFILWGKV